MRKSFIGAMVLSSAAFCFQFSSLAMAQSPSGAQSGGPATSQQTQPGGPTTSGPATASGMPDTTGQTQTAPTKADDKKFAKEAAIGGLTEVELAKVARQKASSDAVKQFAQRMIDDHTKGNEELKQAATKDGITIPEALDAKHQSRIAKLSKLSGTEFDRAYIKDQLKDHEKDVKEFQNEAQNGTSPAIKSFAGKTLPVLQQHLEMVKDLSKNSSSTSMNAAK